jgi:hypothetical protein
MTDIQPIGPKVRYYFVDEAGDPVLFDRHGRILVGKEGCSRFFMLGFLDVMDPRALTSDMAELRSRLLADPYFKNVPSMQQSARKTALAFHAKDDLPEVRREVFSVLMRHPMTFNAVIRDKKAVLSWAQQQRKSDPHFRYNPNDLYDSLVRRLFKNHLHKAEEHRIFFSKRGTGDRSRALTNALNKTRARFCRQWQKQARGLFVPTALSSWQRGELQAVDYFLWALQRLYERGEERYLSFVWPSVGVVHDVDDTREAKYGVYYNKKRPLNAAAIKPSHGI